MDTKLFAFTLDLEPDYGRSGQYELFQKTRDIEEVLIILASFDVKLTVFTVGEVFELYPDVIRLFEKYACEFEVHSYSHDLRHPDSEFEIQQAKKAYFSYFQKYPKGYRAPEGRISDGGIEILAREGFHYDSSIFPSYFPNPFRYLFRDRQIHYHINSQIMEIPLTAITPFRLTLSVSYLKLCGFDFYRKLFQTYDLPEFICFDSHLHDFIPSENTFRKLPSFWNLIYSRNKYKGIDYCIEFLQYVKNEGYNFHFMSEIYDLNKQAIRKE